MRRTCTRQRKSVCRADGKCVYGRGRQSPSTARHRCGRAKRPSTAAATAPSIPTNEARRRARNNDITHSIFYSFTICSGICGILASQRPLIPPPRHCFAGQSMLLLDSDVVVAVAIVVNPAWYSVVIARFAIIACHRPWSMHTRRAAPNADGDIAMHEMCTV